MALQSQIEHGLLIRRHIGAGIKLFTHALLDAIGEHDRIPLDLPHREPAKRGAHKREGISCRQRIGLFDESLFLTPDILEMHGGLTLYFRDLYFFFAAGRRLKVFLYDPLDEVLIERCASIQIVEQIGVVLDLSLFLAAPLYDRRKGRAIADNALRQEFFLDGLIRSLRPLETMRFIYEDERARRLERCKRTVEPLRPVVIIIPLQHLRARQKLHVEQQDKEPIAALARALDELTYDAGEELTPLRSFLRLQHTRHELGLITTDITEMPLHTCVQKELRRPRLDGERRHDEDEFIETIAAVQLIHRLRIDIRLPCPRLHLDIEPKRLGRLTPPAIPCRHSEFPLDAQNILQ